jgi:hypothetical protein
LDQYDNVAVGALFVQFAGTMAAVAFTALVLILTLYRDTGQGDIKRTDAAASLFLASFVVFVFATQMYTAVGTETRDSPRLKSHLLLADVVILIAFMHLFLGLLCIAKRLDLPQVTSLSRILPGVIVPVVGYGYIYGDVARARPDLLLWLSAAAGVFAVIVALVLTQAFQVRIPRPSVNLVNTTSFGYACACVLIQAFVQFQPSKFMLPTVVIVSVFVSCDIVIALHVLLAFRDRLSSTPLDLRRIRTDASSALYRKARGVRRWVRPPRDRDGSSPPASDLP